ncbi:hypothetical protein C6496_19260 [Candidatus Poribacteria bacterium]|nr:MAG: hypothetical protein C6496_19260 [Candidatus Poribacteria bacterium]
MFGNRRSELMLVGLLVWFIVSAGIFMVLVLPFVVPQHQLAQFVPECISQVKFQKPCAFCGMTTAFYAISRGDFTEAYRLNPLSLYVYSLFALNTFCAVLTLKHTTRFIKNLGATLSSHNLEINS